MGFSGGGLASGIPVTLRPTGAACQSMDRTEAQFGIGNDAVSGQPYAVALPFQRGQSIANVFFTSANIAAVAPTHQWVCITDVLGNVISRGSDLLTQAWPAATTKPFPVTFAPSVSGIYYAVICVVAGTVPNWLGCEGNASALAGAIAPKLNGGVAQFGLVVPADLASPMAAINQSSSGTPYAYAA